MKPRRPASRAWPDDEQHNRLIAMKDESANNRLQKPPWLRRRLPSGPAYEQVRTLIRMGDLHTVCQEAQCPNQFECFSSHTATFLILGSRCTRNCRFCSIEPGPLAAPDPGEPRRVAEAAAKMKLNYVVVTSVTRDDLPDGGAGLFAETIRQIRQRIAGVKVEVLIPDLQGRAENLAIVLDAAPDVLNHNVETVARLYARVRPQADYLRSLTLLKRAARMRPETPVKSGLMLGLGETDEEIEETLKDIRRTGCRILTLGQYLQPSPEHLAVERFVTPEAFDGWRRLALGLGFDEAACGPFVRSSYHAGLLYQGIDG
jgi:lipoic acid synthetase